jgi:hypothetical protein
MKSSPNSKKGSWCSTIYSKTNYIHFLYKKRYKPTEPPPPSINPTSFFEVQEGLIFLSSCHICGLTEAILWRQERVREQNYLLRKPTKLMSRGI